MYLISLWPVILPPRSPFIVLCKHAHLFRSVLLRSTLSLLRGCSCSNQSPVANRIGLIHEAIHDCVHYLGTRSCCERRRLVWPCIVEVEKRVESRVDYGDSETNDQSETPAGHSRIGKFKSYGIYVSYHIRNSIHGDYHLPFHVVRRCRSKRNIQDGFYALVSSSSY
ncbi:hypothetical protein BDN70DRAFT_454586 [Pholiota conissans]|uniref:Uncharacterized protein n=1 Tax=Pholiota conissans TaxID=109636 RepID=A0A9P5YMK6_9AGAR|nr:hypothetical protein BDN70DRAFT_454586 [Pholiota conissans]